MKAKQSVTLFFVLGLVIAIIGFFDPAIAQDERSSAISMLKSRLTRQFAKPLATGGQLEQDKVAPNAPLPLSSLRVTGSALRPLYYGVGWDYIDAYGGSIYADVANEADLWNTPVYLPEGSVVNSFRMYYFDNSPNECFGFFTIYDNYGNIVDIWNISSSGTPGNGYSDSDPINHTIDYENYSYTLEWVPNQLGSTMMLHGFRIYYYPSGARYGSSMILSVPPPPP